MDTSEYRQYSHKPMNIITSEAIIMRVKEFGESDLLITFFTPGMGQLKGVAKGGRRSRKRFVNCLDIFCLVNLEFNLKKRGSLFYLNSGKLINPYPGLRSDFASLSKASYLIELTELLFPQGVVDREIFLLLKDSFDSIDNGEKIDAVPIFFEIRAMTLGGYGINLEKCCICGRSYTGGGTAIYKPDKGGIACLKCRQVSAVSPQMSPEAVKMLKVAQTGPPSALSALRISGKISAEIRPVLRLHREYHLGKKLKTSHYLE